MAKRQLTCCVCGEDAGHFEQHWNRDFGWGICAPCVINQRKRGETDAEIRSLYGIEGVNYAPTVVTTCRRGDRVIELATGRVGMVVWAYPNGTPDEPQPWAQVVLSDKGAVFASRLYSELRPGGDYGR